MMAFKHERFLIEAIEQCQLKRIITLIKHGHNIHIQNNLGQNLLVHLLKQQNSQDPFFEKKRFQIFQFLITRCHLEVHSFDHCGKNLFNWATNMNCTQEALYLLRSYYGDIDILIRDHSNLCSLHYAIEHGNEILVHGIVEYLLQYRLRFDITDNHDNSPDELAKKLGYDQMSDYLAETCRSTIFMSRKIPFTQQRLLTTKSKNTALTKSSSTSGLLSSIATTSDISEFYQLIESKIEVAKNLNDWKTVALLRTCQTNLHGRKLNKLPVPTLQINKSATSSTIPLKVLPLNLHVPNGGQPTHMLHLIESQLSPSYRRPFIPYYERPLLPDVGVLASTGTQRKMSMASSRRMSSVMNLRKRDSNASQLGVLMRQDGPSRLSLPPVYKQHRQPIVAGRSSDPEALEKLRGKNLIRIQN